MNRQELLNTRSQLEAHLKAVEQELTGMDEPMKARSSSEFLGSGSVGSEGYGQAVGKAVEAGPKYYVNPDQVRKLEMVRIAAENLLRVLDMTCPESPARGHVRKAFLAAYDSIALDRILR